MRDKRPVDELSVEELERILAIRKRKERQKPLDRMKRSGRLIADSNVQQPAAPPPKVETVPVTQPDLLADTVGAAASAITFQPDVAPRFEDDLDIIDLSSTASADKTWKTFVNRALIVVEVAAVVGLVYIGATMFTAIGKLEKETADAQSAADEARRATIPTLAPTPQLRLEQIVLPSGHKYTKDGGQFNFDEIPANLLPAVQSQLMQPVIFRPQPTDETARRLIIPKLKIDQTIVQGIDWDALKQGIGQVQNGVNPGDETGNVVFAAHNDIYGEIFRHLDQLEPGDEFQIQTNTRVYNYVVRGYELVKPTDVHMMDNRLGPTATLISCYPYQVNSKRIVVFADREDT